LANPFPETSCSEMLHFAKARHSIVWRDYTKRLMMGTSFVCIDARIIVSCLAACPFFSAGWTKTELMS